MKKLMVLSISLLIVACGENSDGSKKSTYTSCSITDSQALLASDRAKDVAQCWDGVDYKEKSLAMDWCAKQVSSYIANEYIFGHAVTYLVASTNCSK